MSSTVVIVGAGPIGLALACELGRAGVDTVVLERRTETDLRSPGMAANGAVVEMLDERGLLDPLREHAMELPAAHFSNLWLDMGPLAGRHANSLVVPQWRIEKVLEARALELGVDVRRGVEVTGLSQDDEGVTVTVSGDRRTVSGAYLVGCDGVDSTVRRLAGIDFPLREAPFYGLIGDIEADWADLLPGQVGAYYSDVGGTYAGTPTEPGVWRISTAEWGVEPPDLDAPVTLDELNSRVLRLIGTEFKNATPRWLARTENPTANAESYRAGRVFLAGDAAHVFFPFNGQRLSTGFQDVYNLGWKLAADLLGWAPSGLLDTYHAERHPAVSRALTNVQAQEALVHPPHGAGPLRELFTELIGISEANRYLVEMVMGLDVRYPAGGDSGDGPVGGRLPHVPLRTAAGETTVAAVLRNGRGVFLDLSGEPADSSGEPAPLHPAAAWADRVDVVVAEPVPQIHAAALLVRPDGHVAWSGNLAEDGTGLAEALRNWFGPATVATSPASRRPE